MIWKGWGVLVWLAIWPWGVFSADLNDDLNGDLSGSLEVETFAAASAPAQLLWIPSEYGVLPEERQLAQALADRGLTVTLPNLFESYFLPATPSSLQRIPLKVIVDEIRRLQDSGQPVIVIGSNQGAALAVKALVDAMQTPSANLALILLNPNLYEETPQAGQKAVYWPQASRLNVPVFVLQAELSPWRWHLPALQQTLEMGGSDVFMRRVPEVRDRYYFRPDALAVENRQAEQLLPDLLTAMQALIPYMVTTRQSASKPGATVATNETTRPGDSHAANPAAKPTTSPATNGSDAIGLQPYTGPQNRPLQLVDRTGKAHDLKAYRGQVVLLNFWASWCPPCVHEIPSMTRLKTALSDQPFEILAANLAEEKPQIESFLSEHPVNFPILLDPKGSAVQAWRVFAYPSTYVIDKQGVIRYALFGGHEWDDAQTLQQIKALLAESP
ncbi:MAG: redoxin domain-containing protein [Hydrogenovibrio sp.]